MPVDTTYSLTRSRDQLIALLKLGGNWLHLFIHLVKVNKKPRHLCLKLLAIVRQACISLSPKFERELSKHEAALLREEYVGLVQCVCVMADLMILVRTLPVVIDKFILCVVAFADPVCHRCDQAVLVRRLQDIWVLFERKFGEASIHLHVDCEAVRKVL